MLLFFFALLAGAITVAGPCILPLLPVILGTSIVKSHPARPLFIILGFVLSFVVLVSVFAFLRQVIPVSAQTIRTIAIVLIGLFGVTMLFPQIQEAIFSRVGTIIGRFAPRVEAGQGGLVSGFMLGTSLGFVWTPCAGPVLGSILTLVASQQNIPQALGLLGAYAIGAAVPMLAIAYGGRAAVTRVRALSQHAVTIQRVFGGLMVLVAFGMAFGLDASIQTSLLEHAPWLFLNRFLNL